MLLWYQATGRLSDRLDLAHGNSDTPFMKTRANCPTCRGELSLLDGLKAPTPFHFRCPHCRAKLSVQMRGLWPLLILVVCLFAGLAVGCLCMWRAFGLTGLFISLAFYAAAGLVADIVCGTIFYTYGTLTSKPTKPRL